MWTVIVWLCQDDKEDSLLYVSICCQILKVSITYQVAIYWTIDIFRDCWRSVCEFFFSLSKNFLITSKDRTMQTRFYWHAAGERKFLYFVLASLYECDKRNERFVFKFAYWKKKHVARQGNRVIERIIILSTIIKAKNAKSLMWYSK